MTARGLTVLELLVTLGLVGLLAAIALPSFGAMRARARLGAAARQVVMDLKLARTRAITDVASHRVRFPALSSSYQHQRQGSDGRYADEGAPVPLPEGVGIESCTAAGAAVGFQPRGHASTFGSITLRGEEGGGRRIVVDIVGRMRIE